MLDHVCSSIRDSYDTLADEYARHIYGELEHKPFDRDLLIRFAAEAKGAICDLGCGPGHVARYLREQGADVFGVDLSPKMIEEALRLNPGIGFTVGDMLSLNLTEGSIAEIVAFYSIVNLPPNHLPTAFSEMQRVLRPGGRLLLSFHIGHEALTPGVLWDRPISMQFFLFETAMVSRLLQDAGFEIGEVLERQPYAPDVEYQSRRAYIVAAKKATCHQL